VYKKRAQKTRAKTLVKSTPKEHKLFSLVFVKSMLRLRIRQIFLEQKFSSSTLDVVAVVVDVVDVVDGVNGVDCVYVADIVSAVVYVDVRDAVRCCCC
jgi:hypothetical protein